MYRSASLGDCLDEAMWGHGYATEAAHALRLWAFDTLDLNRVQAEAYWVFGLLRRDWRPSDGPGPAR